MRCRCRWANLPTWQTFLPITSPRFKRRPSRRSRSWATGAAAAAALTRLIAVPRAFSRSVAASGAVAVRPYDWQGRGGFGRVTGCVCRAVRCKRHSPARPVKTGRWRGRGWWRRGCWRPHVTDRQPVWVVGGPSTTRSASVRCSPPDGAGVAVASRAGVSSGEFDSSGPVECSRQRMGSIVRWAWVLSGARRNQPSCDRRTCGPVADGPLRSSGRRISPDAGPQASGPARCPPAVIAEQLLSPMALKTISHHGRVQQQRRHQSKG